MSSETDFSLIQMAELGAIAANAGASFILYKRIVALEEGLATAQDSNSANSKVNNELINAFNGVNKRIELLESRMNVMEQRYQLQLQQSQLQQQQQYQYGGGGYGDIAQTDPRGYNPINQPRYRGGEHDQPHNGGGMNNMNNMNGIPKPTEQSRYQPNRSDNRSERIPREQLMADAMKPPVQ